MSTTDAKPAKKPAKPAKSTAAHTLRLLNETKSPSPRTKSPPPRTKSPPFKPPKSPRPVIHKKMAASALAMRELHGIPKDRTIFSNTIQKHLETIDAQNKSQSDYIPQKLFTKLKLKQSIPEPIQPNNDQPRTRSPPPPLLKFKTKTKRL